MCHLPVLLWAAFSRRPIKPPFFFFSYCPFVISSHLGLLYHRHVCYPIIFELQVSGAAYNLEYQIFKFILFPSALHHLCVICSMVGKQGAWV